MVTALESASRTVDAVSGEQRDTLGGLAREVDQLRETRATLAADAEALADLRTKLGDVLNAAIDETTAASGHAADEPLLAIDEDAFNKPVRPAREEDLYIPPLRGRLTRPGGGA